MEPTILRGSNDKLYDRRKAAAVESEKLVLSSDMTRITQIIDQLCAMFTSTTAPLHSRNGGLIGLAATAIASGQDFSPFSGTIIPPISSCFQDPESRLRYHACESLYNIAKVSKGEISVHFNEIFDALSKLSSDSEASVKNGAELSDRLMKDIVAEAAPNYISAYSGNVNLNLPPKNGEPSSDEHGDGETIEEDKRAFSLARFIPLLAERVYVISPYTRMHLVSWLMVLDSVPDSESVAWSPEFLDGSLKYLADQNVDVRLATENVLAEFLREIKYIANVQEKQAEADRARRETGSVRRRDSKQTIESGVADPDEAIQDDDEDLSATIEEVSLTQGEGADHEWEGEGSGAWVPGQGVFVDHAAIMDIIIQHSSYPDELVQSTAMEWILTFLEFAQNTVVAFTPRIVPAISPNLASPHRHIKLAAHETNGNLYRVIQSLPLQVLNPPQPPTTSVVQPSPAGAVPPPTASAASHAGSPPSSLSNVATPVPPSTIRKDFANPDSSDNLPQKTVNDPLDIASVTSRESISKPPSSNVAIASSSSASNVPTLKSKPAPNATISEPVTPVNTEFPSSAKNRSRPASPGSQPPPKSPIAETIGDDDPFDVRETVNVSTLQFLSDHAETRIAALEWLLMLHSKAPTKILSRDSGTFPASLKTLSDPSEDVVKHDLQLLAQISASSEDFYFTSFMKNVLELFSTDRRSLETRGSLIIRQLCSHLNAERIFRTIAEISEKDDDLEFASMMVVKSNMISITSPELADFRRRSKHLDSKDGQMLFSSSYRSWCHNAVAVFASCLLAQAYEHASNSLQIFAELELTVSLSVQIDKLVMLIESPVFTNSRSQLLEPDKYPYLPKCLYGSLMISPQSSAFVSLRARSSVVYSSGYAPTQTKTTSAGFSGAPGSTRSKLGGKDEIKWQELSSHFRSVQARHEKARRQLHSGDLGSQSSVHYTSPSQTFHSAPSTAGMPSSGQIPKTVTIKKKTGSTGSGAGTTSRISTGMSPLNPRRGGSSSGGAGVISPGVSIGGAVASMNGQHGLGGIRPASPPAGRRRILGGIRKAA